MRAYATSVRVPPVRSRLDPVEAMMSDCQVKDDRGRREVIVLSASQDHLILHLHVTVFVSDSSRLVVNLYALPNGRQERSELVHDLRRQESTHLLRANGRLERSELLVTSTRRLEGHSSVAFRWCVCVCVCVSVCLSVCLCELFFGNT